MSSPRSSCVRTMSATALRTRAARAPRSTPGVWIKSSRSSGRGRLPACVVRIRSVLCFMAPYATMAPPETDLRRGGRDEAAHQLLTSALWPGVQRLRASIRSRLHAIQHHARERHDRVDLARREDHRGAGLQRRLTLTVVEEALAFEHVIDLVRHRVAVDRRFLAGLPPHDAD